MKTLNGRKVIWRRVAIKDMKQIIAVNNSLKLPKGKLAAQVAHAAVATFIDASHKARRAWLSDGMPKVVVKGRDVEELKRLEEATRRQGIPATLITDAGKTVLASGTITALGLGPAKDEELDNLTGGLKLL